MLRSKGRFRLHPIKQQMAQPLRFRLEMIYSPSTNCGVDFGRPFLTIQERARIRTKRYLSLLLCLQTHCCHLEMAHSLHTARLLNALARMAGKRGWPKMMLSGNGTNFVAGDREIRDLVEQLDQEQIQH